MHKKGAILFRKLPQAKGGEKQRIDSFTPECKPLILQKPCGIPFLHSQLIAG